MRKTPYEVILPPQEYNTSEGVRVGFLSLSQLPIRNASGTLIKWSEKNEHACYIMPVVCKSTRPSFIQSPYWAGGRGWTALPSHKVMETRSWIQLQSNQNVNEKYYNRELTKYITQMSVHGFPPDICGLFGWDILVVCCFFTVTLK